MATQQPTPPPASGLPHYRVDSEAMGSEAAYLFWQQTHSVLWERNDDPPDLAKRFSVSVTVYYAGQMLIAGGWIPAYEYLCGPARAAANGMDHYVVLTCRSGGYSGSMDGAAFTMGPRDVVLLNCNLGSDFRSQPSDYAALVIPRALLAPLLTDAVGACHKVLRADTPMCKLLYDMMVGVLDNAHRLDPAEGAGLARSCAAMVAVAFGAIPSSRADPEGRVFTASRVAIKRYIDDHLSNPDLDVDHLVETFGVSRAKIYRMFAETGGIADHIRKRRLHRALLDLGSAEFAHMQIAHIALRLGFASAAGFARTFKAEYGVLPSEIRGDPTASLRAAMQSANNTEPVLAEWLRELA